MRTHPSRFKAPGSFRADGETSAETMDGNGRPVRVSFDLQAPPGSSRLCLHCPVEREPSWWDIVVASHGDAVLFRIEVEFDGNPFVREHTLDYFIYRASSSARSKLTLLPRSYFTEAEIMEPVAEDVDFWRRNWRMVNSSYIGLLTDEQEFVVAELYISGAADEAAPLEAPLFRLHSSPGAMNGGGGQWELTIAKNRDGKVRFKDVLGWQTHKVVPFTSYSYLCWVDYNRGVLFCDVFNNTPQLQYLQLPIDDDGPHMDYPTEAKPSSLSELTTAKGPHALTATTALLSPSACGR
uniref:DUF1618 domain-containing protein n=1 Tax=Aegilops tauschii TaxID=37682 RepID=M8CDV2_AEGTA